MLTWTEIETRAAAFQKTWREASGTEKQDDQKFIADFLNVFGLDWRIGLPQHQVYLPNGTPNYIDYLLPGQILIEMKSKGKSLDAAYTQAMTYLQALKPDETPKLRLQGRQERRRVLHPPLRLRTTHPPTLVCKSEVKKVYDINVQLLTQSSDSRISSIKRCAW